MNSEHTFRPSPPTETGLNCFVVFADSSLVPLDTRVGNDVLVTSEDSFFSIMRIPRCANDRALADFSLPHSNEVETHLVIKRHFCQKFKWQYCSKRFIISLLLLLLLLHAKIGVASRVPREMYQDFDSPIGSKNILRLRHSIAQNENEMTSLSSAKSKDTNKVIYLFILK